MVREEKRGGAARPWGKTDDLIDLLKTLEHQRSGQSRVGPSLE